MIELSNFKKCVSSREQLPFSDLINALPQFTEYLDCYFGGESYDKVLPGRKEVTFMGNLCAYQFWQRVFKVK